MILHHPYDDTLARYAAGSLGAGPSFVVATHLAGCGECRKRVALFEATGGALLAETQAAPLTPEFFAESLDRLDTAAQSHPFPSRVSVEYPSPLNQIEIPQWRHIGPGIHWRRLTLPYASDANLMMLRVAPGSKMPNHSHSGTEYTQVLKGSFHDNFGRYLEGDCVEADEETNHQPVVDSETECVCLAAIDGRLLLRGWIGRLAQFFMGI